MTPPTADDRRRARRPLRELNEDELDALDRISRASQLLADDLQQPLGMLGDFASYELDAREVDDGKRCSCGLENPGPEHRAHFPMLCREYPEKRSMSRVTDTQS